MEFNLQYIDDITFAQVREESIRADNAQEFKACLLDLIKPDTKIVLDMGNLKFMDSSGIGALLSFVKKSQNTKESFRLCNVTRQVQNLFDLVRVNRFLHVFQNCDEAVHSFIK
jgi:anti-sigma B factor antagonist